MKNKIENKSYHLFLDDERNPYDSRTMAYMKMRGGPDYKNMIWEVAKNFEEFQLIVDQKGIPEFISYDHDLSSEHYDVSMYHGEDAYNEKSVNFTEKTGRECAEYLCSKLQGAPHPRYIIHSMNPLAVSRITGVIRDYNKSLDL